MFSVFRSFAAGSGRLSVGALVCVGLLCGGLTGTAGYAKYRLDRAEAVLAAPDSALGGEKDSFGALRHALGYGGFLGAAQRYALTHDSSGIPDMKGWIRAADDLVAHLPDSTSEISSADTHAELAALVASFDAALQKIEKPVGPDEDDFSAADLAPLYAALPVLDARVTGSNAQTRLTAQTEVRLWALILAGTSWASLLLALSCALTALFLVRDRRAAPLQALAQSIRHMVRGDMRAAIWGIERQDTIGEVARAVDMARYHFSHLPDVSLLSDQGPVRLRFEGETRSLFEAMMKNFSRDSDSLRGQATQLAEDMHRHKDALASLSVQVEGALSAWLRHGQGSDQQLRAMTQEMTGTVDKLKNAHAHAADQLNRLIPHIQERATSMAEITQMTGRQMAQTLQSIASSDKVLKAQAEGAGTTLARLSATADTLGERLFGAINLLQAGGKVLAETGAQLQKNTPFHDDNRLASLEAQLSLLCTKLDNPLPNSAEEIVTSLETFLTTHLEPKLEALTVRESSGVEEQLLALGNQLALLQTKLDEPSPNPAPEIVAEIKTLIGTHLEPKLETLTARDPEIVEAQLFALGNQLALLQSKLDEPSPNPTPEIVAEIKTLIGTHLEPKLETLTARDPEIVEAQLLALGNQLTLLQTKLDEPSPNPAPEIVGEIKTLIGTHLEPKLETLIARDPEIVEAQLFALGNQLTLLQTKLDEPSPNPAPEIVAEIKTLISNHLEPKLAALVSEIQEQEETWARTLQTPFATLNDKIDTLPEQTVQKTLKAFSTALTTEVTPLTQALAESRAENAQIHGVLSGLQGGVAQTTQTVSDILNRVQQAASQPSSMNRSELLQILETNLAALMDGARTRFSRTLHQEITPKLDSFDQALGATRRIVEDTRLAITQAPPSSSPTLQVSVIQQQLHDQSAQLSAQVEAVRAGLTETLSDRLERLEDRLAAKGDGQPPAPILESVTQRQIQQQTHILSELVATLGVLDAHMQQIKTDMRKAVGA